MLEPVNGCCLNQFIFYNWRSPGALASPECFSNRSLTSGRSPPGQLESVRQLRLFALSGSRSPPSKNDAPQMARDGPQDAPAAGHAPGRSTRHRLLVTFRVFIHATPPPWPQARRNARSLVSCAPQNENIKKLKTNVSKTR